MSDKLQDAREAFEAYRLKHNARPIEQRVTLGPFRLKSIEPVRWYQYPSLAEAASNTAVGPVLLDSPPEPQGQAVERESGPSPKPEAEKPEYHFLKGETGLDVFLVELKDGPRTIIREVEPRVKSHLFKTIFEFTRGWDCSPIAGRTGTAWLDTRERLPDGSRVFVQVLSDEPKDGYFLGDYRAFSLTELPEGLPQPDDYQARENLRKGAESFRRFKAERATLSANELHEDLKDSRARATRQRDIDVAVEKALKQKEGAPA